MKHLCWLHFAGGKWLKLRRKHARGCSGRGTRGHALELRAGLVYGRGDPGSQGAVICPRPCPRQPARSGPISLS